MEDIQKHVNFAIDAAKIATMYAGPALAVAAPLLSKLLGVRVGPGRAFALAFSIVLSKIYKSQFC